MSQMTAAGAGAAPVFGDYTAETAPAASRRIMAAIEAGFGYLPVAVGRLAVSPHLLEGFGKVNGIFENTTLDPIAREVLIMTIAVRNGCHICVAMHTQRLTMMDADAQLTAGLRESRPLQDARLEALRAFTLRVLDTTGDVSDEDLRAFLRHGFTAQNALEVVLGIGTYTISTLANRLTRSPVDDQLAPFAWQD